MTFELKPGDIVRAAQTHGDFVLVRAADGRSGEAAGAEVERIIPSA